jgi:hypothetical protein
MPAFAFPQDSVVHLCPRIVTATRSKTLAWRDSLSFESSWIYADSDPDEVLKNDSTGAVMANHALREMENFFSWRSIAKKKGLTPLVNAGGVYPGERRREEEEEKWRISTDLTDLRLPSEEINFCVGIFQDPHDSGGWEIGNVPLTLDPNTDSVHAAVERAGGKYFPLPPMVFAEFCYATPFRFIRPHRRWVYAVHLRLIH